MKAYLASLREWFLALAPRERLIVAVGGVAAGIILLYGALWTPLVKAHHGREQQLAQARELAQRLENMAADVQRNRGAGRAVDRSGSLIAVIDQASKSGTLGKAPTRLQPEGDQEVRVWLDAISFDALARWVAELEARHGVQVASADIEKQTQPGTVNARLSLVRP